jgi:hypothetical protein
MNMQEPAQIAQQMAPAVVIQQPAVMLIIIVLIILGIARAVGRVIHLAVNNHTAILGNGKILMKQAHIAMLQVVGIVG